MKSWNTGRCCFWTCCCTGALLQRSFGFSGTTPTIGNARWLLRHGRSRANEAGRIVSQPANALLAEYGLSAVGREQARTAAVTTFITQPQEQDIVLITSDFTRAQETAEIVQQTILEQAPTASVELHIDVRLRERDFGDWELTDDSNYVKVWADDAEGITRKNGVESVTSVLERSRACIDEWDGRYENCCLVFVAHGDVLQILQTSFANLAPTAHRSLAHLETATPRKIL